MRYRFLNNRDRVRTTLPQLDANLREKRGICPRPLIAEKQYVIFLIFFMYPNKSYFSDVFNLYATFHLFVNNVQTKFLKTFSILFIDNYIFTGKKKT